MTMSENAYKQAGVDVEAGYESVRLIKDDVKRTAIEGVIGSIGGFGGLFEMPKGYKNPVLVSGTDGVGTKIKVAFLMDKHDTIGQDCVAMCVNDVACSGAKPLFFLDYIACGKNYPEKIAEIVSGVAEGCVRAGCALIGGETAEHPGMMPEHEYDLAGFAVGIADRSKMLDIGNVHEGDAIIALPSSGVHSNGFSLVRAILRDAGIGFEKTFEELDGKSIGEVLLTPTEIYVKPFLKLLGAVDVRSAAHITGGGFYENIPRALPKGLVAEIDKSTLRTPAIFGLLGRLGNIPEREMFNVFNMGVGMMAVVAGHDADTAVNVLNDNGVEAYICGAVRGADSPAAQGVTLC